jgi:hypothetical protein
MPMKLAGAPLWLWVVAGVLATVVMDIGGGISRAAGLTAGTPPPLLAKWLLGLFQGRAVVDDIRTSPGADGTLGQFLSFHYVIGVTLTLFYAWGIGAIGMSRTPVWIPVAYGLATTALAAFWMFPSLGFGALGMKGPPEFLLLRTALLNHFFFGVGLAAVERLLIRRFQ